LPTAAVRRRAGRCCWGSRKRRSRPTRSSRRRRFPKARGAPPPRAHARAFALTWAASDPGDDASAHRNVDFWQVDCQRAIDGSAPERSGAWGSPRAKGASRGAGVPDDLNNDGAADSGGDRVRVLPARADPGGRTAAAAAGGAGSSGRWNISWSRRRRSRGTISSNRAFRLWGYRGGGRKIIAPFSAVKRVITRRSDQIRSDPIRSDPIRSDPIRSDPIRSDPTTTFSERPQYPFGSTSTWMPSKRLLPWQTKTLQLLRTPADSSDSPNRPWHPQHWGTLVVSATTIAPVATAAKNVPRLLVRDRSA